MWNKPSPGVTDKGVAMVSFTVLMTVLTLISTVDFTEATVSLPVPVATTTQGNTIQPWCSVTDGETFDGWYDPNGNKITTDKSERKHVESVGDRHTLSIKNVDPTTDGGIYQCRGNLNSGSLTVNIGFVANPPSKQKLLLNEPGTILLNAHGYPNPTYTWKKNGAALDPNSDSRITLQVDGSLKISKVEVSDEAEYVCDILQGITSKQVTISVSVIQKPVLTLKPKETRSLTEGFNTTFKCNATGRPQPTIRWIDAVGTAINSDQDSRYSISDGYLTITGVLKKDTEKSYTCEAKNEDGESVATAFISKVWAPPKLKDLSDETKNKGEKVTLVCEAESGDKPMEVVWKKDGVQFKDQTQSQKEQKSTIVFEKIQNEHSGKYSCEAKNGAKDENGNTIVVKEEINLFVKSPPELNQQKSTSPVYSFVGNPNPVKIVCEFFGYPLPNITMTKNGTELVVGQTTVTHTIAVTKESSFGLVHCFAINKNGNASHVVELKKAAAPEAVKNLKGIGTCKSIKVTWENPDFDGGLPITTYDVKIEDENDTEVAAGSVNVPTTHYSITQGIVKEKQYKVSVSARSAFPKRGARTTATFTTTKYCAPSKPVITTKATEPLNQLKLKLTWTRPDNDGGDPDIRYKVSYISYVDGIIRENKTIDTTNQLEMEVGDKYLKAGRTYSFRITAINGGGESLAAVLLVAVSPSAGQTTTLQPPSTKSTPVSVVASTSTASTQAPLTGLSATALPAESENGTTRGPEVGARREDGLSSGVIAAIVIVIILIVLIAIDLFCCYFNSCGLFFCCHKTFCGRGEAKKKAGKEVKSAEMEKLKPPPEQV